MAVDDADLVRYWFTFDLTSLEPKVGPARVDGGTLASRFCGLGVGVTGYDAADCLELISALLRPEPVPPVMSAIRDVDVDALGLDHRFVGIPVWRGVWFPNQNGSGPTLG